MRAAVCREAVVDCDRRLPGPFELDVARALAPLGSGFLIDTELGFDAVDAGTTPGADPWQGLRHTVPAPHDPAVAPAGPPGACPNRVPSSPGSG